MEATGFVRAGTLGVVVAAALGLGATLAFSERPKRVKCEPGRFVVTSAPLLAGSTAPGPEAVVVEAGRRVGITSGCDSVKARIRALKNGTRIVAKWPSGCEGIDGVVKLKATIDGPECEAMEGTLVARKAKVSAPFVAERSRCGDDRIDTAIGEECDGGFGCDEDATCRPDTCTCEPSGATTSTTSTTTTTPASTTSSSSTTITTTTTASTSTLTATSSTATTTTATAATTTTTSTVPTCGDGLVNQASEECDPPVDLACPGQCEACTCVTGCAPPEVTGLEPRSGEVGTSVTLTGSHLECGPVRAVTCGGVPVPIAAVSATGLLLTIPPDADDCRFVVETSGGTLQLPETLAFDVTVPGFTVTAIPETAAMAPGGTVTYTISATGPDDFADVIAIGLDGTPAGVTATLSAATMTAGQSVTLTLTAAENAAAAAATLTITGTATLNGAPVQEAALVDLEVTEPGRTGLTGNFRLADGPPLPGVTLTIGGQTLQTDGGGNFLFLDIPEGPHTMSVNATTADPRLPMYGIDVVLVAGKILDLGVLDICPPLPPERYTPLVSTDEGQTITDPNVPGVEMFIPGGTTITGWDGKLKTQMTVERLMPEKLPVPPPPGAPQSLYQPFFGTPMGGLPTAPIGVSVPNDEGLEPGEKAEFWFYDAAPIPGVPGSWRFGGFGTVSDDGASIATDPGVGITRFCGVCGLWCFLKQQLTQPNNDPSDPTDADPVNLAIGQMVPEKIDLILPGRIPAEIRRTYNPFDPFGGIAGFSYELGAGWALSVEVVLQEETASMRRLIMPGNARFTFAQSAPGTFVNQTHAEFAGAVLSDDGGGAHTLRFPDGTRWRFAPASGLGGVALLAAQIDRWDNELRIEHGSGNKIERIIEPAGRELTFVHESGRLVEVNDPIGRTVRYSYGANGRLEAVTDPAGGVTRYRYDGSGRILGVTDPKDIEYVRNEYSPTSGRLLRQTLADGGTWRFRYQLTFACAPQVVSAGGGAARGGGVPAAASPTCDANLDICCRPGSFVEETGRPFPQAQRLIPDSVRVAATVVVDPMGHETTYVGRDLVIDALGGRTRVERDAQGNVEAVIDPIGRITRFAYDAAGNLIRFTDPTGAETLFEYEPVFNQLVRLVDPLGNATIFARDDRGNLVAAENAEGDRSTFTYDAFGSLTSATDAEGNQILFGYDPRGDLTTVTDPSGHTSRRTWDAVSRLAAYTDPRGRTVRMSWSPLNALEEVRNALGTTTRFEYDPNGNLTRVTDGRGHTRRWEYDVMDRAIATIDPVGRRAEAEWDLNGNLVRTVDRRDQTTEWAYDALDRPTTTSFADGSELSITWDAAGRPSRFTDSLAGTIARTFDALDRVTRETSPQGSVAYTYDAAGRRTALNVNGRPPTAYDYNAASQLLAVGDGIDDVQFAYDANGRRRSVALPNGVTTEYEYDASSRLVRIVYRRGDTVLDDLRYVYDENGARTGIGGSLAHTVMPPTVDAAMYDAANQQLAFGSTALGYDGEGNLTSMSAPNGPSALTWDARNRLVELAGPGGVARFEYDALNRRVAKRVDGLTTEFLYDRLDVAHELVGGTPIASLRGLQMDELFLRGGQGVLTDALGSTVALTGPTGQITGRHRYGPFGRSEATGTGAANPFQFTGRENDGTGLYYYRARYYSPELQRFIAEDPIGLSGGSANFYLYVENDPANLTDPTGEIPPIVIIIGVGGVVGGVLDLIDYYQAPAHCPRTWGGAAAAFGGGFAEGAVSAGVGAFGGPILGALAGKGVDLGLKQLSGRKPKGPLGEGSDVAIDILADVAVEKFKIFKTIGRVPNLLKGAVGKNTYRLAGQEAVGSGFSYAGGQIRDVAFGGDGGCP